MPVDIIGQDELKNRIDNTTLDTFPHSLILKGAKGSGKHLFCEYIAEHLGLELIDITDKISLETLTDITIKPTPAIYVIDGTKITVKQENIVLKFLEEPSKSAYIIILCEALRQLLDTIRNRCQCWSIELYNVENLKLFVADFDKAYALQIADTPGQLLKLRGQDVDGLFKLCETIVDKIGNANYANTLTITDKIAFDGETDKFDLDCFIQAMNFTLMKRVYDTNDRYTYMKMYNAYDLTLNLLVDMYTPHINKKYLMDNYLTNLKKVLS